MFKSLNVGTYLAVQQLRLCTLNAGGVWSVPGWGTKSLCALRMTKNNFGKESKCTDHGWRVVFNAGLVFWAGSCCLGVCVEKDSEVMSGLRGCDGLVVLDAWWRRKARGAGTPAPKPASVDPA